MVCACERERVTPHGVYEVCERQSEGHGVRERVRNLENGVRACEKERKRERKRERDFENGVCERETGEGDRDSRDR